MRSIVRALLFILALLPDVRAAGLALVLSDSKGPYAEFSGALHETLDGSPWKIIASGGSEALDSSVRPDLIVAVGGEAFRRILARGGNTPVLAALVPRPTYEKILADSAPSRPRTSAIFLEQPAARQAAFIRQLLPGLSRIGILHRRDSTQALAPHVQAMSAAGLVVETEETQNDNDLLPALNTLLPKVNALLALPDPNIYKRDNIKAILVTTYRHQKPLIAFSPTLVNAGALAALYTTPAQAARQTGDLILTYGTALPTPREPSLFAIAINQNVAQALNLSPPDEATLRRSLLRSTEAR